MSSKIWFIAGASRGFGKIWAEAALRRGDKVAATARNLDALSDLVEMYGDSVLPLKLDVTDRDEVFKAVDEARWHFGRLDVVLCNAGYGLMGAIEEVSIENIRENLDTNVVGTISVIQAALPWLRAQGSGHILTVSSVGGVVSFPTGGIYVASKFAVEGFSDALSQEVADFGIKVTIIEPGSFATDFRSSMKLSSPMKEYDQVRDAVYARFNAWPSGDPAATSDAIFKIVDADQPPLRLVLGSSPIPVFREVYAKRLETWAAWEEVSVAAQGGEKVLV